MDTTDEPSYSLEDLSAQTGFDVRVIRSFIEQDLLLGPASLGRYARYSEAHLTRLLAIKALKEKRGLKHGDIRQALLYMTDSEVLALADTARGPDATRKSSALDYLRSLNQQPFNSPQPVNSQQPVNSPPLVKAQQPFMWEQPSIFPKSQKSQQSQSTPGLNSQQSLTQQPSQAQSPRQQPASETWIRFQITPDVELSVRGIQTDQQMARMKSVANNLRDILIGGQNE